MVIFFKMVETTNQQLFIHYRSAFRITNQYQPLLSMGNHGELFLNMII